MSAERLLLPGPLDSAIGGLEQALDSLLAGS